MALRPISVKIPLFIVFDTFEERSNKMDVVRLSRMFSCSVVVRQNLLIQTVHFHNLSRFDGILLLKHLATHG